MEGGGWRERAPPAPTAAGPRGRSGRRAGLTSSGPRLPAPRPRRRLRPPSTPSSIPSRSPPLQPRRPSRNTRPCRYLTSRSTMTTSLTGSPGVKSSSERFDDVFGSNHAPPPPYDDLLAGFGRKAEAKETLEEKRKTKPAPASGFYDLIPGFGGSSSLRPRTALSLLDLSPALSILKFTGTVRVMVQRNVGSRTVAAGHL